MLDISEDLISKIIAVNRGRLGLSDHDKDQDERFSKSNNADSRLCVYGRLRLGGPDHYTLADLNGEWSEIRFPGYLQNGNCDSETCPGLTWNPKGAWNEGFLLSSDLLIDIWRDLDAKEGVAYARLLSPIIRENEILVANVYVSRDATATQLLMMDGMNVHDDVD